ncbi:phosphoesterase [Flavobacterium psychrophilum]|nr:phosphoesterase [Flavobacterium psychrophilum]
MIGVENWGKHFGAFGDIDKALEGVSTSDFKILMSHDPSHWEEIVKNHKKTYNLPYLGTHTECSLGSKFRVGLNGV